MRKTLTELCGFRLGDRVVMHVRGYYAGSLGRITRLEFRGRGRNREACCLIVPDADADQLTRKGDGFYTAITHVEHTELPFGTPSITSVASFGNVS